MTHSRPPSSLTHAPSLTRRLCLLQSGLLLAGCGGGGSGGGGSATVPSSQSSPVCLSALVPAYFYRSDAWSTLATSTQAVVAIANVSNGPGTVLDSQYLGWISQVRAAGHRVKGYVHTSYGARAASAVLADMDTWHRLYGVDDFFIDEASVKSSDVSYYRNLLATAVGVNASRRFMLNPGAAPDPAYFGLQPGIEVLVFEQPWSAYNSSTSLPASLDAFASQCWIMALSASQADMLQAAAIARSRRFAGFFATDVSFTTGLPSYWAQQAALAVCAS